MTLDTYIKELKDLSDEELLQRINEIRKRRVAAPEKAKQAAKKTSKSSDEKLLAALQALPPELRKSILEGL